MQPTMNSRRLKMTEKEEEKWTAEKLCQSTFRDLGHPSTVEERFADHLLVSESRVIMLERLMQESSTTTRDYSLVVDVFQLIQEDPILGSMLVKFSGTLLPVLESSIVAAQERLLLKLKDKQAERIMQPERTGSENDIADISIMNVKGKKSDAKGMPTTRVHARLVHLPPSCCRPSVARMEARDIGKIVQLVGTVVRASHVQMYESERAYKCTGKTGCSRIIFQSADLEQVTNALVAPERCTHVIDGARCKGTNLQLEENGSVHSDYQEIKIQESASRTGAGTIPRSLKVKLQHDLVDRCQPGDEVVVVGTLMSQWQPSLAPQADCNVGMALNAHSIQVVQEHNSSAWKEVKGGVSGGELDKYNAEFEEYWNRTTSRRDPIAARNFICGAVCPTLYGLNVIKLALLVTLIGGVSSENSKARKSSRLSDMDDVTSEKQANPGPVPFRIGASGPAPKAIRYGTMDSGPTYEGENDNKNAAVQTRRRDMSHMLLVGDPGTGKSQFLQFAAALCPRSVLTTGVGTTSAGLTCAAVREGSNKEFALEAGALVLADKGVCCIDEFGCIRKEDRTTIHEAMEQQTLSVAKAGIVCKLNCRTTIIAVMNPRDCIYDNYASLSSNTGLGTPLLSRFDLIFKMVDTPNLDRDDNVSRHLLNRAIEGEGFDCEQINKFAYERPWSMEKLRAYIAVVKGKFQPIISNNAAILLERHYEKVRSAQSPVIPITVRFLESLIRLSQAHARLMYRNTVTLDDAVAVIRIMESTAYAYGGYDGGVEDLGNYMYTDPMEEDESNGDADGEFDSFMHKVLGMYGMIDCMMDHRQDRAIKFNEAKNEREDGIYPNGWDGLEAPRERHEDHYGRDYFPVPNSQSPSRKRQRRS